MAELQFGVAKSAFPEKNQEALNFFLTPLAIVDFNYVAAVEYGKVRADLIKKGTPIGTMDMLIAAHAKSMSSTVVTNNEREFNRVYNLKVENWIK